MWPGTCPHVRSEGNFLRIGIFSWRVSRRGLWDDDDRGQIDGIYLDQLCFLDGSFIPFREEDGDDRFLGIMRVDGENDETPKWRLRDQESISGSWNEERLLAAERPPTVPVLLVETCMINRQAFVLTDGDASDVTYERDLWLLIECVDLELHPALAGKQLHQFSVCHEKPPRLPEKFI